MPQPTPVRAFRVWAAFTAFTAELATMPEVVARLAEAHAPDGAGLCRACGRPGRGTAHVPWPCSLARLAEAATVAPHAATATGPAPSGDCASGAPATGTRTGPPSPGRGARPDGTRPATRGAGARAAAGGKPGPGARAGVGAARAGAVRA